MTNFTIKNNGKAENAKLVDATAYLVSGITLAAHASLIFVREYATILKSKFQIAQENG